METLETNLVKTFDAYKVPKDEKNKDEKKQNEYEAKKKYIPQQIIIPSDMSANASDKISGGKPL